MFNYEKIEKIIIVICGILIIFVGSYSILDKDENGFKVIKNYKIDHNISSKERISLNYNYYSELSVPNFKKYNNKRIGIFLLLDRPSTNIVVNNFYTVNRNTGISTIPYDIFVNNDKIILIGSNFKKSIKQVFKKYHKLEISIPLKDIFYLENNELKSILRDK